MIKGFFNFVFIWLLFLSSVGYALFTLQRPGFLVDQARDVRLYERLAGNIESIFTAEATDNLPFDQQELTEIVTTSVDADTFYTATGQATNAYIEYLTSRSDTVSFDYDLRKVKEQTSKALTSKLVSKYNNLPECRSNQLKGWSADSGLPDCRLPSTNVQSNDVERLFERQATELTTDWPDTISLPEPNDELAGARENVTRVLRWIYLAWAATAAFLLLYLLIFRRRGLLSLAVIFLLAGLLEIGFGMIGWEWLAKNLIDLFSGEAAQLAGFAADMAAAIAEILKTIMGNLSIITLSLGGFFLIVGLISRFGKSAESLTPRQ